MKTLELSKLNKLQIKLLNLTTKKWYHPLGGKIVIRKFKLK